MNIDKYELYENSVQNAEYEADLIAKMYRKYFQVEPCILREDFCGSFALCREWLHQGKKVPRIAIGIDHDPKVLAWGEKKHLPELTAEQKKRLQIICGDVRTTRLVHADVCTAFNFSYWIFLQRTTLIQYFRTVRKSLRKRKGIFLLDAYGGTESEIEKEESRREKGFTFIWEQRKFFPGTREMDCRIHFRLASKKTMRNAFRYYWRLWTPPEITDALIEAGFTEIDWYYEGTNAKTGEGNGRYYLSKDSKGENAETWIGFAVARA